MNEEIKTNKSVNAPTEIPTNHINKRAKRSNIVILVYLALSIIAVILFVALYVVPNFNNNEILPDNSGEADIALIEDKEEDKEKGTEITRIIDAFLKDRGESVACPWDFLNDFPLISFGDETNPSDATPRDSNVHYHGILTADGKFLSANMMGVPDESNIYLEGPMVGVNSICIVTDVVHLEDYVDQRDYLVKRYNLQQIRGAGLSTDYASTYEDENGNAFGICYSGGNALGGYSIYVARDYFDLGDYFEILNDRIRMSIPEEDDERNTNDINALLKFVLKDRHIHRMRLTDDAKKLIDSDIHSVLSAVIAENNARISQNEYQVVINPHATVMECLGNLSECIDNYNFILDYITEEHPEVCQNDIMTIMLANNQVNANLYYLYLKARVLELLIDSNPDDISIKQQYAEAVKVLESYHKESTVFD